MTDYTNSIIKQLITAYGHMVQTRIDQLWGANLISVTFEELPGDHRAVRQTMEDEVARLYRKFVKRVVRNPRTTPADKLPMWICVPDYPVYKRNKQSIVFNKPNAGRHYHILALTPWWSRIKEPLWIHFDDKQGWYRGQKIWQVDARPITHDADFVTDYAFKATKTRRVNFDEVIIFPVSSSEVPAKRPKRR